MAAVAEVVPAVVPVDAILCGDALERLRELPDGCVQCCVTSPPYFGLRDYGTARWEGGDPACDHVRMAVGMSERIPLGHAGHLPATNAANVGRVLHYPDRCAKCGARRVDAQIGLEATPEAYVAHLVAVLREVRRVLRADGTCWINVGDAYSAANARHASLYGISGRVPADSPAHDSSFESLCGACLRDWESRRSRTFPAPVPTPTASLSDPSQARMESVPDRPPTSDSSRRTQTHRSSRATRDRWQVPSPSRAPVADVPASTSAECAPQLRGARSPSDTHAASPSVPLSSFGDDPVSARMSGALSGTPHCTAGTASPSAERVRHIRYTSGCCSRCWAYTDYLLSDIPPERPQTGNLKPKDLIGLPWMLAFALRADGWWLRAEIVWHKPNPMPESVTDRPTRAHEMVYLLAKSARYYYDAEAISEEAAQPLGFARRTGQHKAAILGHTSSRTCTLGTNYGTATRNRRDVWTISPQPFRGAHFATMPPALVEPCILAGTSPMACESCGAPWRRVTTRGAPPFAVAPSAIDRFGTGQAGVHRKVGGQYQKWLDAHPLATVAWAPTCRCPENTGAGRCVVLDPFAGACTVPMVARRLGRRYLGIELNPEYVAMGERRIAEDGAPRPAKGRANRAKPAPPASEKPRTPRRRHRPEPIPLFPAPASSYGDAS